MPPFGLAPTSHASKRIWDADPDRRFLFHYTDAASAEAIFATRTFRVGQRHPRRPGIYVCGYAPGAATPKQLRSLVLDGAPDWDRRTFAVVVIEDMPPLRFQRDAVGGDAWFHQAMAGAELSLPLHIVGYGLREAGGDRKWRLSYGCYEE
jgi:hypothetical protein